MLGVGGRPYDPALEALVQLPGSTPRAFNMVLDLTDPIADPGGLELRPMTAEEFDVFVVAQGDGYAADAGRGRALARGGRRAQPYPDGGAAAQRPGLAGHGVLPRAGWADTPVGVLWLNADQPMAFVYDVEVVEPERRKGYGAAIMNAAALWSRDHDHPVLGLNVFAHNPGAKALYEKLGYRVTVDYRTFDVPDA